MPSGLVQIFECGENLDAKAVEEWDIDGLWVPCQEGLDDI